MRISLFYRVYNTVKKISVTSPYTKIFSRIQICNSFFHWNPVYLTEYGLFNVNLRQQILWDTHEYTGSYALSPASNQKTSCTIEFLRKFWIRAYVTGIFLPLL